MPTALFKSLVDTFRIDPLWLAAPARSIKPALTLLACIALH